MFDFANIFFVTSRLQVVNAGFRCTMT
jgi:hypothetical protein